MLVARILPAGRERKYRVLRRSSQKQPQFRRLSARSLFSVYNRLPPFAFRYWENSPLLPANYPTLQVHGKVYPSARIVNETARIPLLSTSRSLGWMTCMLVISTSGRIYTGPAGGPGPTVYITRPLQRATSARSCSSRSASVVDAVADEAADNMLLRNYYGYNVIAFTHINQSLFFHLFFK